MKRKITLLLLAAGSIFTMNSQVMINENFTSPFNAAASGWSYQNLTPTAYQTWFQGSSVFTAYNGAATDYLACNWASSSNTTSPETLSNWLISPTVTLVNGGVLSFATRTGSNPASFPDRLEVYYSLGNGTNVGSSATSLGTFSTLIVSINPNLTTTGYPGVWTVYTNALTGISTPTVGRIAFRYHVTNGGPATAAPNSDFIGLDAVKYFVPCGLTLPSYTVCAGSPATLAVVGTASNTTYTWSPNTSSSSSVVVNPSSTTVYTLTYDEGQGACPPITSTVTVGSQLSVSITASAYTVCAGRTVTLTANSAASTYSWNTGATGPVTTVTVNANAVYSVGVVNSNFSCFGGNTVAIVTIPNPTLSALINPSVACPNSSFQATASGASTYIWVLGTQATTLNPITINTGTNPAGGTGTLGLIGTGANGCSVAGILNFSVAPSPTVNAVASPSAAVLCINRTVTLTASGASSYAWSGSGTSSAASFTQSTGTTAGNKTFTVVGTDANGCTANSTVSYSVSTCAGIEKVNGNSLEASAYPNPFTSVLNLSGMSGRIEIYNSLGQMVIKTTIGENETITTNDLTKGAYILKSYGNDGNNRTIKLLKN